MSERESERERERERVNQGGNSPYIVDSIAHSLMVYSGLGLLGLSRHYRKRGCFQFVLVRWEEGNNILDIL